MKKMILLIVCLFLADILVIFTGAKLVANGDASSLPFLLVPVVILAPFHILTVCAYKEEKNNKE